MNRGTGDDAATFFMEMLWTVLCTHIPFEQIVVKKRSHPLLNRRCENAIQTKNDAEGTAWYDDKRDQCSRIMVKEHLKYTAKLEEEI